MQDTVMDLDRPLTREDLERIAADLARQNAVCIEQAREIARLRAALAVADAACHSYYEWEYGDAEQPDASLLVAWKQHPR